MRRKADPARREAEASGVAWTAITAGRLRVGMAVMTGPGKHLPIGLFEGHMARQQRQAHERRDRLGSERCPEQLRRDVGGLVARQVEIRHPSVWFDRLGVK